MKHSMKIRLWTRSIFKSLNNRSICGAAGLCCWLYLIFAYLFQLAISAIAKSTVRCTILIKMYEAITYCHCKHIRIGVIASWNKVAQLYCKPSSFSDGGGGLQSETVPCDELTNHHCLRAQTMYLHIP